MVLGALSPRTRNAQVELYQSGDVDYLVATDAIGMGLNLDVDHVAFAADRKFDGFQLPAADSGRARPDRRPRRPPHARRHLRHDRPLPAVRAETRSTRSRTTASSPCACCNGAIRTSTSRPCRRCATASPQPPQRARADARADRRGPGGARDRLARRRHRARFARSKAAVERLWEVCQVPDYRKVSPAEPCRARRRRSTASSMRDGVVPDDWFARQRGDGRPHRRRHRHAVRPHRAGAHLDLRRQPAGLAGRSRALAGRHASGRGQAVGRAA